MVAMDYTPHSLHAILSRIREQMRCPQCGTPVPVDFPAIKIAGDDFMLLQLCCGSCSAFIVLHVNLATGKQQNQELSQTRPLLNASSTLSLTEQEMTTLRTALRKYDGSFEKLFRSVDGKD